MDPPWHQSLNERETPLDATFNALVTRTLDDWHVPGMSVAVIDGDKTFAKVCSPCVILGPGH